MYVLFCCMCYSHDMTPLKNMNHLIRFAVFIFVISYFDQLFISRWGVYSHIQVYSFLIYPVSTMTIVYYYVLF